MDLTNFYFKEIIGYYSFESLDEYKTTENTIAFLVDARFSTRQIINFLQESNHEKCYLSPKDLPDSIWSGLTERNRFYIHPILQLRNDSITIDETGKMSYPDFFLEINPNFTMESLIEYCNKKLSFFVYEENKIKGSLEYLLEKYKKLPHITSLDMVLRLIDKAEGKTLSNLLDIQSNEESVYEELKNFYLRLKEEKMNQIVWRT